MEKGEYDLAVTFPEYLSEKFATPLELTIRFDKMLIGLKGLNISSTSDIEKLRLAIVKRANTDTWIDQSRTI
ncbi:hypothetical protein [Kiloniella sp. EL199]|uniref:hypothetical protein n=1 Tax=Kiloniella sp. EL199 TaxID=2107581 RepID=UPI0013C3EA26|nr:hypothetical protein [Kiloniella sp. EL199]